MGNTSESPVTLVQLSNYIHSLMSVSNMSDHPGSYSPASTLGNLSNLSALACRVEEGDATCQLCSSLDYWVEGPIILAICLAGILGQSWNGGNCQVVLLLVISYDIGGLVKVPRGVVL